MCYIPSIQEHERVWSVTILTIWQGLNAMFFGVRPIGLPYKEQILIFLEKCKMEAMGNFPSSTVLYEGRKEFPKFDPTKYVDTSEEFLGICRTVRRYLKNQSDQDLQIPKKEVGILMQIISDLRNQYPL